MAWRRWTKWNVNPFLCPINYVLDYLSDMPDNGSTFRIINVHRSAISAYYQPVGGISVVLSPVVCNLLSGTFNNRPSQPKYTFIWDEEKVLNYLKAFQPQKDLPDKELPMKLAMLDLTAAVPYSGII